MQVFAIDEDAIHRVGDGGCPECLEDYPEPCGCGGLIHAEAGGPEDEDGNVWLRTRCGRCRRSTDDVDEELGRNPP
jgi:hypothetical protein